MTRKVSFGTIVIISILLGLGCQKQNSNLETLAVIGIHPCTAGAASDRGYVIRLAGSGDTVLTFDLPEEVRAPINISDSELEKGYLFPAGKVFYFNLPYRLATPEELAFPICLANINTSGVAKIKNQIRFALKD